MDITGTISRWTVITGNFYSSVPTVEMVVTGMVAVSTTVNVCSSVPTVSGHNATLYSSVLTVEVDITGTVFSSIHVLEADITGSQ